MPARKIDEDLLMDRLTHVFRLYGYEGASLSRIAEATGLKRASLYHRFPGGKEDMAEAVLKRADEWFASHILAPLTDSGEPAERIREMARRLSDFYGNGQHSCLLDSLSIGEEDAVRQHVEKSFKAWLSALIDVARESGLNPTLAKQQAEEALVNIQGSLVFARATGDTKPFLRTLRNLPHSLTLDSGKSKPKTGKKRSS